MPPLDNLAAGSRVKDELSAARGHDVHRLFADARRTRGSGQSQFEATARHFAFSGGNFVENDLRSEEFVFLVATDNVSSASVMDRPERKLLRVMEVFIRIICPERSFRADS
ncbi:MAG: hypothetical protein ACREH8_21195 [Opitutaceae bacterium]